jgi:hypothetical protein
MDIIHLNLEIMKNHYLLFVVFFCLVLNCTSLDGQKTEIIPLVCLNHVVINLDTVTFNNLFNSSFLSDTVGNCEAHTQKTTDQEYSGKYLFGEEGYLEFFPIKDINAIPPGSLSLGFITFRTGDI